MKEILLGFTAGILAGLLPGLHPNNLSLLLVPLGPLAIIAAFVAQSFSAVFPSVFIGAPAPGSEAAVLPAHRMLLAGKAKRAVFISIASMLLALGFFLLALPLALFILPAGKLPPALVTGTLVFFGLCLVMFEDRRLAALAFFAAAAAFGSAFLSNDNLFPIFAGLFGASTLIESIGKKEAAARSQLEYVPLRIRGLVRPAAVGALCGFAVGTMPALSVSAAAAVASVLFAGGMETELFLSLSTAAGFSSFLFSLPAAARLGAFRNGSLAAAGAVGWNGGMMAESVLLIAVCAAAAAFLTRFFLEPLFLRVARVRWLNEASLVFLFLMVGAFSGVPGLLIFSVAAALGLACGRAGVSKRVLMGALLWPTAWHYLRAGK